LRAVTGPIRTGSNKDVVMGIAGCHGRTMADCHPALKPAALPTELPMLAPKWPHYLGSLATARSGGRAVSFENGGYMRGYVFAAATVACSALLLAGPVEAGSKIKQVGMASWYKMGTQTANGERYDPMGITAAHPSLPFDTKVRVTNPDNGKSVVVRINDRGPFAGGRIIDLSQGAAQEINLVRAGIAQVKIEVLGPGPAATETAAADSAPPPSRPRRLPKNQPLRLNLFA
jgi:rare lipoprotein A (peptidoglycan hydrolase)